MYTFERNVFLLHPRNEQKWNGNENIRITDWRMDSMMMSYIIFFIHFHYETQSGAKWSCMCCHLFFSNDFFFWWWCSFAMPLNLSICESVLCVHTNGWHIFFAYWTLFSSLLNFTALYRDTYKSVHSGIQNHFHLDKTEIQNVYREEVYRCSENVNDLYFFNGTECTESSSRLKSKRKSLTSWRCHPLQCCLRAF